MAGNDTAGMGRDRGDPTGGNDNRNDSNDAYGGSDDWDDAENEARAYEQNERDGSSDYAGGRNPYGLDTSLAHTPVERQAFASRERQDDLAATSAISFADEAAQRGWLSTAFNHLPGLVPGNDVQAYNYTNPGLRGGSLANPVAAPTDYLNFSAPQALAEVAGTYFNVPFLGNAYEYFEEQRNRPVALNPGQTSIAGTGLTGGGNYGDSYQSGLARLRFSPGGSFLTSVDKPTSSAPEGFIPPKGPASSVMVEYYNPALGETWSAPSSGWTPAPGWVAVPPQEAKTDRPASEEAQGRNPFFAADPTAYTPSVAPYRPKENFMMPNVMSGGGGTPFFRDGGPVGYAFGGEAQRPLAPSWQPGGSSESPFGLGGAIPAIDSLRDLATSGRTDLNSSLYGGGRGGTPLFRDGGPVGYASGGEAQMPRPMPGGGSSGGRGGTIPAIYSLGDLATSGRTDLNSSLYGGGRGGVALMRDGGSMGFRPLGMQAGGVPVADVAPDVRAIFQGLVAATQSGSAQDVAAYIESNRRDLNDMVSMMMLPQGQADFITNTINSFAPPSVPQMDTPPQGMRDFPGYVDFYPPQQVPQQMPAPSYPFSGDVEEGDQYIIPGTPPPGEDLGLYSTEYPNAMNRGGLMSLRRG
jgi:hypothetical protein